MSDNLNTKKRFALTGAAGYIAPRHMEAILENGCDLSAILDPSDSVGVIDSYFPNAKYFNNFERFERHINKVQSSDEHIDYLSVCSPNYLHDTHCRFALHNGMNAVCEKPLVLSPWNIDMLQKAEQDTGNTINTILQLRLHPEIINLKQKVDSDPDKTYSIDLHYITSRGPWYQISWKGQEEMSGGITSNIGVHFFDMLIWIFGKPLKQEVFVHNKMYSSGHLELEKANINWFLSVDSLHLEKLGIKGQKTFRSIKLDGSELEFSRGFENLHILSYKNILEGKGFSTEDARPAIELVHSLRNLKISEARGYSKDFISKLIL